MMDDFIELEGYLPGNNQDSKFVENGKFDRIWSRYKVKNLEDPRHGENLLAAVEDFNSCNI